MLESRITRLCNSVMQTVRIIEDNNIEFLDISGVTNNRLRKPNSRSKINGRPAFNEPVKHVKIRIPQLKN